MRVALAIIALLLVTSVSAVPLSVIDTSYTRFDEELEQEAFIVNVRGDNSADYIVGADPSEITGERDGETVQAENGFELRTSVVNEQCTYPLVDTPERTDVYQYQLVQEEDNVFLWDQDDFIDQCLERPGGLLGYSRTSGPLLYDVYCLVETKVANAGAVREPIIQFQSRFDLTRSDGETITRTISTAGTSQDDISSVVQLDDIAVVRWIGGTTFGEGCPGQDEYVSIQYENEWRTANKDRYTEYAVSHEELHELRRNIARDGSVSSQEHSALQNKVTDTNSRSKQALGPSPIIAATNQARIEGSQAILQLPRDRLVYAPDFQIALSASWLEFVFTSGKPRITDAAFQSCIEGDPTNVITTTVENVGASPAQFVAGIQCESGVSVSATERRITLDPDESGTITYPFTLSLSEDQRRSCVVTVTDTANPENFDRETLTAECAASLVCSPEGVNRCFGTVEKQCTDGQWVTTGSDACTTTICNRDGKCDASAGESFEACGGKDSPENDCATCNADGVCDETETIYSCPADCGTTPTTDIPQWAWYAGAVGLAALIWWGTKNIKPRRKKR